MFVVKRFEGYFTEKKALEHTKRVLWRYPRNIRQLVKPKVSCAFENVRSSPFRLSVETFPKYEEGYSTGSYTGCPTS